MPSRRAVLAALACSGAAQAAGPLRLRTPRHASGRDTLGGYAPALLSLALARAPRRHEVVERGLTLGQGRAMVEMQREAPPIVQSQFRSTIEALRLRERRVLELRNPLLPPDAPLQRADWWFRPARS